MTSEAFIHIGRADLELKALTADLLPAVLDLDKLCFGGLWTLEGYQRELSSPNSDLLVLSTIKNQEPELVPPLLGLGCLWAILEEAHITILAIHPHYQNQGLGQTLLYALLVTAHRRGLERATLEVRASNQPAISLYQKFGFRAAGRRRRYYQDTGEDALILWRSGLQNPEFVQTLQVWDQQIQQRLQQSNWNFQK